MKKVRRIAMYGGSFNPIHNAHTAIASMFVKKLKLDKLLFIPTASAPHKSDSGVVDGKHRLEMCRLAAKNIKKSEACDIELNRSGKSYTIDTLCELERLYPDSELYLIMGADMFTTLLEWKQPEEIFKKAVLCTVPRNDDDITVLSEYAEKYKAMGAQTCVLDMKLIDISSTAVRQNIKDDKSISKLVCGDVAKYIYANYLYMNISEINYDRFKKVLRSRMGEKRFIHSCNVSEEAVRLAKKYGADEEKARLAGILHDVTKETPQSAQIEFMDEHEVPLTALERSSPKLWHAISGSVFVRDVMGITDEDVINAIRYHTSGRAGMSVLEKCIFIADFTSAERNYDDVEVMRALADKSLEEAMRYGLAFSISELALKNAAIDPNALECYNEVVLQLRTS